MLQLILGLSGTGKTAQVMEITKARAEMDCRSILLVPEQFTSSAETMAYTTLGDALSAFVDVYSFTSLAEAMLKQYGGVAVETLTDAGRVVLVRRAMDGLGDALQSYGRHRRNTGFCTMCADAIKELKIAGATGETVLAAAARLDGDGAKLHELGLIFAAYEGLLSGSAMDPSDRIATAARRMQTEPLAQTAVLIDNFDGFTAPEYDMLAKLMHAELCTVTLCCDSLADNDNGMGMFSPVKHTAARLRRLAARAQIEIAAPMVLETDYRHAQSVGLAGVARLLAGLPLLKEETPTRPWPKRRGREALATQAEENALYANASGVYLTPATGVYDACKTVAAQIAILCAQGVAYRDIAVICRLLDSYAAPLQYELGLVGIPYFTDATTTLEHTAPAAFFRAALGLLTRGVSTEPVLRMLKTDLCGVSAGDLAALENYAYTWQLRGGDWRAPFIQNPAGFGAELREEDAALLAAAEAVRGAVMPKIEAFLSAARGQDAAGLSKQLYLLLAAFDGEAHTKEAAALLEAQGDTLRAAVLYRTWNTAMALLGEMETLLAGERVTPAEYDELLVLLLRASDIGHVPQTQNEVIVTTADRMRLANPKHCFVLGLSEGEFPKAAGYSGLLTHADRACLVENGVEMPGSYENRTLLEEMFFYRAMTAACDGLYLSAIAPEYGAPPLTASLCEIVEKLAPPPLALTTAQKAPTPGAALDLLGIQYRDDTPETAALEAALAQTTEDVACCAALEAMREAASPPPFRAYNETTLCALLGETMTLSSTRVEKYYTCRFAYFLEYVLHIRPRKKAELSPLESGTLVHYILEHAMRRSGEQFTTLSAEALKALSDAIADEYVAQNMPQAGVRFAYLIRRLKAGTLRLLTHLQKEQAQSSFHPVAFEQGIGFEAGDVPPLTLQTPDGRKVRVTGKIDRVDVMQREGRSYLRVVDYKTGSKEFKLDEVYCGLNTQMLFYLFTLCRNARAQYANPVAAGVLYVAGDPSPGDKLRLEAQQPLTYRVDGLVLDDSVVIRGMDKEATGVFVPLKFNKDQSPRASAKLASLEKLGNIEHHLEQLAVQMAEKLYAGDIAAAPLCTRQRTPCDVCDYKPVCCHESGKNETTVDAPKHLFEAMPQEQTQALARETAAVPSTAGGLQVTVPDTAHQPLTLAELEDIAAGLGKEGDARR